MKPCTLTFKAPPTRTFSAGGTPSLTLDPAFAVTLYYHCDGNVRPLTLTADAVEGDDIRLTLTDAHIALYVNGALCDEEWPLGELALDGLTAPFPFVLTDGVDESSIPLRKHITAEELRLPCVNVGDCMPFSGVDGRYHLYWLYDRHHHTSKWHFGAHRWAHASTDDLVHWDEHPMAVPITEQYEGSICTGSTIAAEGKHYCWYAIRMSDYSPARITYSVSDDGDNYEKSGVFFTLPDTYHGTGARDPKIIFFEGKYHMLITTTYLATGNGCLAHLVSDHADMTDFTDLGPIIEWTDGSQPECPDYFIYNDTHYLIWSIGGIAHYAFSDIPFGAGETGWQFPRDNTLDCGVVPKAAVCPWNGDLVFTGFVGEGGYAGHIIMKKAVQNPDKTLTLFEIPCADSV